MLRLKSILCCLVLLSLAFPLGNAWAKKPRLNKDSVSAITLDVVRVEACAKRKGCVVAGGPMQVDLLDMAKDNIDYVNQILLPERSKSLRIILGDNSTITVDGESVPLAVPSGKKLKLKGWKKAFPKEGGFLSNLELKLNLKRQIVVKRERDRSAWINWKDWRAQYTGDNWRKDWRDELKRMRNSYVYSYKLKPVIRVRSAGVTSVAWNSEKFIVEQFQGTAEKYSLTIVAAKDAENVSVQVVPELQGLVHVLPDSIEEIQEGQEIPLTIIVGFPVDASVGKLDGAILLKDSARNATSKLPVELIVKKWERNDLPSDPGEAGKQTLLGTDSDNDGVRDDVQIAIARHYPESEDEKARLALEQFAASLQYAFGIFQTGSKNQLDDVFSEIVAATDCITGTSAKPKEDLIFVKNIMQNTKERVYAYIDINESAAGYFFGGNTDFEGACKR
ncbi:MAG: hypothetical protein D3924_17205 [Candidatus Electrothrix sp. AR4]|nr:hypothetical protein [Candidatus Electrothrix sp. AR4]